MVKGTHKNHINVSRSINSEDKTSSKAFLLFNTIAMRYMHLVNFESDEYTVKV